MKFDILVPQFDETDEVIRPLLDSINIQQNVDFNDIKVIICNDGSETRLSESLLSSYKFKIEYHIEKHRGVSATRNSCLDYSKADYVMFCDADDMFFNVCGLWMIFNEMEVGFDTLVSLFIEESIMPGSTKHYYIDHQYDSTFVHGKVHRRQYLIDKNIRFNPSLTIHEDSYFNILAQNCVDNPDNAKYLQSPFYLWKWRDNSVCRHDPKYILKTYKNMLDSNEALIGEFIKRGMEDKVMLYVGYMVYDTYYTFNKPEWINQENLEYRDMTEKRFSNWYKRFGSIWDKIPIGDKMAISNQIRSRVVNEGMMMENITLDEWLNNIKKLI